MQVHQEEILLQHIKDLNTSSVCAQVQDLKLQALMTLQDKSPLPYKQCNILQTGGEAQIPFQTPGLVCVWFGVWFLVGCSLVGLMGREGADGLVVLVWFFGRWALLVYFSFLGWLVGFGQFECKGE